MAIGITGKFKPDGNFPLMDAADIEVPGGGRLDEALENVKGAGYVVSAEPPEDTRMLWLDPSDSGENSDELSAAMTEIDALIGGDG